MTPDVDAGTRIVITLNGESVQATLYDNSSAREFASRLPVTLPMRDLYGRELVHRLEDPLPAEEARTSGYEVGDIGYWTPLNSFVLFYAQNGEVISNLQPVGRMHGRIKAFATAGDSEVTFERAS